MHAGPAEQRVFIRRPGDQNAFSLACVDGRANAFEQAIGCGREVGMFAAQPRAGAKHHAEQVGKLHREPHVAQARLAKAHAFETKDAIAIDLLAHADADIVEEFKLPNLIHALPKIESKLVRLSIDRHTGRVSRRALCDLPFEFPQVDWDFVGHASERFVFGSGIDGGAGLRAPLSCGPI